ncbi:hypothetical protein [Nostoc sp. NMS4]|uniref:hypothetical protein n=1 Tax=Nostoc sp. NMS4 TaxID=2815390 RepID=UPI0025EE4B60|nr:hypothetical protein [Nostoc sp. NMS4]MBN3924013.1 hypothetical protein [Nostoc sp. NMS4]
MTHRFDDDGGDDYDGSDEWEPGGHNNPCQLYDDRPRICPYCRGTKMQKELLDYKDLNKFVLVKCGGCYGSGFR